MMPCGIGPLVLRDAIVEVGVAHDTELFEHFERAVNRRDVDFRKHLDDLLIDLIGGDVAGHRSHRVEDELALRGHAQTALPERDFQLRSRNHPVRPSRPHPTTVTRSIGFLRFANSADTWCPSGLESSL